MTSNSPEHDESTGSGAGRSSSSDAPSSSDARSAGGAGSIPSGSPSGIPSGDRDRVAPGEPIQRGKAAPAGGKGRKPGKSSSGGDWNVFRTVVVLVGVVIAGFGAYYLILGTAGLPETEASPANPTLESQFRFFSAMMVGVGAAFITIAVKFQWANMLWLVCLMVFAGGIGRVLSWAFSGTPNYVMIVLMVVELAFPPALLVWHKYIAKTSDLRREFAQRG
ncbi:DUF4345 domain-containing protein [Arthrobacter sp. MDB2-24]